jgi:hypothetical protein
MICARSSAGRSVIEAGMMLTVKHRKLPRDVMNLSALSLSKCQGLKLMIHCLLSSFRPSLGIAASMS